MNRVYLAQEHNTMTRPGLERGPLGPGECAICIWLLTKCQVLFFLHVYGPGGVEVHKPAKKERERIYYLDFGKIFLAGHGGLSRAGKVAPSCPPG